MLLGCIGDDFTGSGDLANTLAKQGMRVVQYSGIPNTPAVSDVEAGVVALKTRSISPEEAVKQSLKAVVWLQAQGCKQFFFKYCSTFDSTREGNIGPVIDALADYLNAHQVIVCPAFPAMDRSIYQGHLFVADTLLSETGMRDHPLTPMIESDIRRWLGYQSRFSVGHISASHVLEGVDAICTELANEHSAGKRHIVVDAMRDEDLMNIGAAAKDLPLVTGGSGIALGLPRNFGKIPCIPNWGHYPGKAIVLSGSCSIATRAQVAHHIAAGYPAFEIDVVAVIKGELSHHEITKWMLNAKGLPLAYSSANPETVARIQREFGRSEAAVAVETFFAAVAKEVVAAGVTRIIIAGGETSGAIVEGLSLDTLTIGPEITPGVPALRALDNLVLALKSGNFGAADFFSYANHILEGKK